MLSLLLRKLKMGRLTEKDGNLLSSQKSSKLPSSFTKSLQIRHLDCGSCNGCDWELTAIGNSLYDHQHFGIDFVASPRHADLLMCTGPGSTQLLYAAHETYEAMPKPKWVVAVGDCAINGGVFKGAYASAEGIGNVLPVDIKIPGCPPSPDNIMKALLEVMGKS
ncbi:NADH-quinone oxidoreductase subunit NuoB [Desulfosporosinus sp. Sb-LF]|uniref:NADH-quinone oxidoreductase subunit B family protein n=1 Tax=Desulfosporosinus sp. Sb-LF TaxID=2560027 RepID=UPI00107F8BAA|nr:NADH-quinone oxidoreductase subunit NuoB [Desulfosporosinus sp. Sb-LF]TGE34414.1 NADH-quinone oxidoreductase subunit NuoB [Desulfosporosinus sp. Sb-LF]